MAACRTRPISLNWVLCALGSVLLPCQYLDSTHFYASLLFFQCEDVYISTTLKSLSICVKLKFQDTDPIKYMQEKNHFLIGVTCFLKDH